MVSPVGDELLAQIGGLHATHGARLFRRLNQRYRAELIDVPEINDRRALAACARLEHELDHIQRCCSTSYGFLVHRLHSARVDAFYRKIEQSAGELRFPLFPQHKFHPGEPEPFHEPTARPERDFHALSALLSSLECASGAPEVPNSVRRRMALEDFERLTGISLSDKVPSDVPAACMELRINHPEDMAFPILPVGRRGKKIGGQGLLEFFAVSREATLLSYAGAAALLDVDQMKSHLHSQAARAWKAIAKLPMPMPELTESWRAVGLSRKPQFPLECRLAIDLAMWPPYVPGGGFNGRKWSWLDIHPGWRYLRILAYLRQKVSHYHLWTTQAEVDDQWMLDFESNICAHFDWPHPSELAALWEEYWSRRAEADVHQLDFLADDVGRAWASVELLATRRRRPFLTVMSYPGAEGRGHHWFEAISTTMPDGRINMLSPEGHEERWLKRGYRLPVGFAAVTGLDIFGTGDWRDGTPSPGVADQLRVVGRGLQESLTLYGERLYGFRIKFGS